MVHTNYQFGRINARENTKPSRRALIVEPRQRTILAATLPAYVKAKQILRQAKGREIIEPNDGCKIKTLREWYYLRHILNEYHVGWKRKRLGCATIL